MKSAIVLQPGKFDGNKNWFFVAINFPTVDLAVSYTPERLGELNPFQKGVAFFLLAGVNRVDEIAHLMGVTDDEFIVIILSELVQLGYARRVGEKEFSATAQLKYDFTETHLPSNSTSHHMVVFIEIAGRKVKVKGPLVTYLPTSEVMSTVDSYQVSVGTEGKPIQVDCLISDVVLPISQKVDRAEAKDWILVTSAGKARRIDEDSTNVEITQTQNRSFVLQFRLKDSRKSRPLPNQPKQLSQFLLGRFAGEKTNEHRLAKHLEEIALRDNDFFESILLRLQSLQVDALDDDLAAHLDSKIDQELDNVQQRPPSQTQQRTRKRKPLATIVGILNKRLSQLGTESLERMMVGQSSVEWLVSERLAKLASRTLKPVVSPLQSVQLEAILANELHNELDICPVLGAWLLLERNEILSQLVQLNQDFVEDICGIFLNPHLAVGKSLRESFEYLETIDK